MGEELDSQRTLLVDLYFYVEVSDYIVGACPRRVVPVPDCAVDDDPVVEQGSRDGDVVDALPGRS